MPNWDEIGPDGQPLRYDTPGLCYDALIATIGTNRMSKIKLDIYGMSTDDEIAYLGPIVTKMTGNSPFTTLASKTTALGTAVTAYATANADYLASQTTTDQKRTALANARTAAENAARDLATGAQSLTHDAATLQSGGWEIQADSHTPVGPLPRPANLVATGGDHDGTVDLAWDAIKRGVQTYIAQQATSASGPWTQCYVGKPSSCTVTGLTSGTQYWFQVSAIGAAGPSPWSDPATKRAT
jgi:hypothetical protein